MSPLQTRTETDSLGAMQVPADRYWGAQTQRSLMYFKIGGERMPLPLIHAFGLQKEACARVNKALGLLDGKLADAIIQAAQEVARGELDDHFPLVIWQTGSGTQTNMNVNEVISNRAIALLGGVLGSKKPVHPNDHVNLSQSSNDSFPTVMHVAIVGALKSQLLPALGAFHTLLCEKAEAFFPHIKIGRTHLQDATPLRLSDEFGAFAYQISQDIKRIESALPDLYALAQGGTAVGPGLNAPKGFGAKVAEQLALMTATPFRVSDNPFEALSSHDPLVFLGGGLATLAASLTKIANDIRWLASGPRCGLGELMLPENEPGSSIMPGKVNPTQSEALTMVAAHVMGLQTAVTFAGASGHFQLNVYKPLIAANVLQAIRLLSDGVNSFAQHCLAGLEPHTAHIAAHLENSLMLVTALTPHMGYDAAASIATKAMADNLTLRQAAVSSGLIAEGDFDRWVRPEAMVGN